MKYTKYIFILLLTSQAMSLARINSKTFSNIIALGSILANSININTNATINNNLTVSGTTHTNNLIVNNSLEIRGQITIQTLGSTPGVLQCCNNGQITSSKDVQLDSITKNGTTVLWPTNIGATGTFLSVVSPGKLGYASAPTNNNHNNVSTLENFSASNHILVTTDNQTKNITQSVVSLNPSTGNISGISTINATNINLQTGNTSSPAITFAENASSGIYSPEENSVAISSSGVEMVKTSTNGTIINNKISLNCATRFTGPLGFITQDIKINPNLYLNAYPNTSIFLLSNSSASNLTLNIIFDSIDQTGRIITFVQTDKTNGSNTIDITGTGLQCGTINLIPIDYTSGSGYSGITIMCIGNNLWMPIAGYKI